MKSVTRLLTREVGALGPRRLSAGIFLASFSTLLLELALTRIFSVSFHYHLSFLVVSLAMLGLGASGVMVSLRPPGQDPALVGARLARAALIFSFGSVVAVGVAFNLSMTIEESGANALRLLLVFGLCTVPFAAGGYIVSLALAFETRLANRLYAFDLVGAALACAAFVPAANLLGPTNSTSRAPRCPTVTAAPSTPRSALRRPACSTTPMRSLRSRGCKAIRPR